MYVSAIPLLLLNKLYWTKWITDCKKDEYFLISRREVLHTTFSSYVDYTVIKTKLFSNVSKTEHKSFNRISNITKMFQLPN